MQVLLLRSVVIFDIPVFVVLKCCQSKPRTAWKVAARVQCFAKEHSKETSQRIINSCRALSRSVINNEPIISLLNLLH